MDVEDCCRTYLHRKVPRQPHPSFSFALFARKDQAELVQGIYVKGKGADSLLGQLGYILEETPAQPSAKDLQEDAQAAKTAAEQHLKTENEGIGSGLDRHIAICTLGAYTQHIAR